jgi:hypothetical protein
VAGAGAQPNLDGAQAGLAIVDHVGHEALLAGLDRALGHDQGVLASFTREGDFGEEARFQGSGVLDPGQDFDLAGGRVGHLAHVVDPGREILGAESRHPEGDVAVLAGAQGLSVRDLEPQAKPGRVHEGGQDLAELDVLAGFQGAGVDHPGTRRADLGLAKVLMRDP